MSKDKEITEGFMITQGKGFCIRFANKYAISVQFGTFNYCDNKHYDINSGIDELKNIPEFKSCANAEVVIFDPNDNFVKLDDVSYQYQYDDVIGYQTPADVIALINKYSSITED